eukprot:gene8843-6368_t
MKRAEAAVITDEHRQPFSVLSTAKRYPGNIQMVGDTIETMDKSISRLVYRTKGDVSSKNYLSVSNLDLVGPIFVLQLSMVEPLISTIHIEVMTSLKLPLRITLSTLYGKDPPTFLGRSMRLPLPSMYNWMNLVINLGDIIEQYCRYDRGQAQMRMGRVKKIDVCSNTIIRDIVSVGNYADVAQLKILAVKPNVDVPVVFYDEFCRQFRVPAPPTSSPPPKTEPSPPKSKPSVSFEPAAQPLQLLNPNALSPAPPTAADPPKATTVQDHLRAVQRSLPPPPTTPTVTTVPPVPVVFSSPVDAPIESPVQTIQSPVPPPPPPIVFPASPAPPATPSAGRPAALATPSSAAFEQRVEQREGVVIAADDVVPVAAGAAPSPSPTPLDFPHDYDADDDGRDAAVVPPPPPLPELDEATLRAQEERRRALEAEEERQKKLELNELVEDDDADAAAASATAAGDASAASAASAVPATPATVGGLSASMYRPPVEPYSPPPKPMAGVEVKLPSNERVVSMEMVMGYRAGPAALVYNSRMLVHAVGSFLVVTDLDRNSGSAGYEKPSFGLWKTLLKGHANDIGLVEVSRNDSWMVTAETGVDRDGLLIVWDLKNGSRIASLRPHPGRILSAALNHAETQLVTAGLDTKNRYQLIVWDIAKLAQCQGVVVAHQLSATSKEPQQMLAVAAIVAKQISDFDVAKVSFNRLDDAQLVSCGRENIRVWRIHRGHLPARPVLLNAYARNVLYTDVAYDVPGGHVYVASDRGHVLKIHHPSLQVVAAFKLHDAGINCIRIHSACCITGGRDHLLRVWPLDFNDFLLEARHEGRITCLALPPGDKGHRLVIGTDAGTLGILDLPQHRYETMVRSHHEPVTQLLERRGNETLVSVGSDNTVRVWNAAGQQIVEFWSEHDAPTSVCDVACEANHLLAGFASGYVRLFDIATAVCALERCYSASPVTTLLFSTFLGRWVIVGYANGLLHVLDHNDHLRLVYEFQSPVFYAPNHNGGGVLPMAPKAKLSPAGDVLVHEYGGKVTVFDLPHMRILLDSFDVWPTTAASTAAAAAASTAAASNATGSAAKKPTAAAALPVLGLEVVERFDTLFLIVLGERLCKLYSFDVRRYDDVSEIRVLLHSQLAFAPDAALHWAAVRLVKVVADVSLLAFLLAPPSTSPSQPSSAAAAKDACVFTAKFDICRVAPPATLFDGDASAATAATAGGDASSARGRFAIHISKPAPQTALSAAVNDVAWCQARRQLVTATAAGYLAFWRVHPLHLAAHVAGGGGGGGASQRSSTAVNLFGDATDGSGGGSGGGSPMPPNFPSSPLAQQQLRRMAAETAKLQQPTRQVIETHGRRDVVRIDGAAAGDGADDEDDDGDRFYGRRPLRSDDLLRAEDHRSVVSHAAAAEAAAEASAAGDGDALPGDDDGNGDAAVTASATAAILDLSDAQPPAAAAAAAVADFDALWRDDFAAATSNASARPPPATVAAGRSRSPRRAAALAAGGAASTRRSARSRRTGRVRVRPSALAAAAASTPSRRGRTCYATRIVLTKADLPLPFTVRRVWRLFLAPLRSDVDAGGQRVVHTHSVLLLVSDSADVFHFALWTWSHVGTAAAPPVATLPQCVSLDAVLPPFALDVGGGATATAAMEQRVDRRVGRVVWLSDARFAVVRVKDPTTPPPAPQSTTRDQLVALDVRVVVYLPPALAKATLPFDAPPTLSPPAAVLERQQLLEIPGHALFGLQAVRVEPPALQDALDLLAFSTGYCCVLMEVPPRGRGAGAGAGAASAVPKVWLNDVKNRGNFLAMTAQRVAARPTTATATTKAVAILAAVNHAAELHVTLFQPADPAVTAAGGEAHAAADHATKLVGRSTVGALPSVNHLAVDPLHPPTATAAATTHVSLGEAAAAAPEIFTALALVESPSNKQRQRAGQLAYQLFLVEAAAVRLYDLTVTEVGARGSSIRAALHGLRRVALDFLPVQLFAHQPPFANQRATRRKLLVLGARGQLAYLDETHAHGLALGASDAASSSAPSTTAANRGAAAAAAPTSNVGVQLKYATLVAAVPAAVASPSSVAAVALPAQLTRELSGGRALVFVPSGRAHAVEGVDVYALARSSRVRFDAHLLKLRFAAAGGAAQRRTDAATGGGGGGFDASSSASASFLAAHSARQSSREVTIVAAYAPNASSTGGGDDEDAVGYFDVDCHVRDEAAAPAVTRLLPLPLPFNPRRAYFYDGNLDDEGSISSADPDADTRPPAKYPPPQATSASAAFLGTDNAQQRATLLAAAEVSDADAGAAVALVGLWRKKASVVEVYRKQWQLEQALDIDGAAAASLQLSGLFRVSAAVSGEQVVDAAQSAYFPRSAEAIVRHLTVPVNAEHLHVLPIASSARRPVAVDSDDDSDDRRRHVSFQRQHQHALLCALGRLNLATPADSLHCHFAQQPDFHHAHGAQQTRQASSQPMINHLRPDASHGRPAATAGPASSLLQASVVNVESVACKTLTPQTSMLCDGDWSRGVAITLYHEDGPDGQRDYAVLLNFAGQRLERIVVGPLP